MFLPVLSIENNTWELLYQFKEIFTELPAGLVNA